MWLLDPLWKKNQLSLFVYFCFKGPWQDPRHDIIETDMLLGLPASLLNIVKDFQQDLACSQFLVRDDSD